MVIVLQGIHCTPAINVICQLYTNEMVRLYIFLIILESYLKETTDRLLRDQVQR